MPRGDSDDSEVSYSQHPALRNWNRTGFMVKHVVKQTLKWGAIGLVAGGVAMTGLGLAIGWGGGLWTAVTAALSALFPNTIGAWVATKLAWGIGGAAGLGGVAGALVGGIIAISGASEAADAEEDRRVAKYEQQEARRDRMAALERRRDEQRYAMERQGNALKMPNHRIPRGRQAQKGMQAPA